MKTKAKNSLSCCNPSANTSATSDTTKAMRKRYGGLAKDSVTNPCCSNNSITEQAGYSQEELELLPAKASAASAGCGNPTALAGLKKGEVVLDLGSGGGIDVFLAAKKVGSTGRVIGVDMTPEMLDLARANAETGKIANVEFRLGEIEHLPVADRTVDIIISNCVINLSTEKDQVFKEAYRVLKNGGRLLVSDMMVKGIPTEIRKNLSMWAACIGGAIELHDYTEAIRSAGFTKIEVVNNTEYPLETIKDWIVTLEESMTKKEREALKKLEPTLKDTIKVSHAEISAMKG